MISLRTIVVSLLSFAIAMFALPGLAQSPAKQHSIDVRPTSPPAPSSSSNVFVTISNETPSSGNSTINSFVITIPAGISVANPQSTPGDNPGATVEKRSDGKIYVNGFSGLKSGRRDPYYRTVKLRATYNTLACDSRFTWSSVAYTGNAFSQETFAATIGTGTPGVTNAPTNAVQSAACGYTLAIAPSSVIRGKAPTLTATITNNSSSAGSISSVTLTPPAGLSIVGSNVLPLSPAIAPGGTGTFAVPVAAPCSSTDTGGSWGALVAGFTPPRRTQARRSAAVAG